MRTRNSITRRDFVKTAAGLAAAGPLIITTPIRAVAGSASDFRLRKSDAMNSIPSVR